uniref:EF-hand domain-containing protein n=1 Tax=Ditylum brightwellii TaxID=49249 RepID=A0A7S4RG15_9STRA|mmetsp:Transcript_11026/g.14788  ORF Transcript_11026/g.14788 Transcript_11026/m.14788 type:complete len:386 (-) Transcript_11026:105-1262(-)
MADIESTPLVGGNNEKKKVSYAQGVVGKIKDNTSRLIDRGASLSSVYEDYSTTSTALLFCFSSILIYLVIGVTVFSYGIEHWSIIDSLYFTVVTFTTVGYGDIWDPTIYGQLFVTFFTLFGVSILGIALGILGERVVNAQEAALESVKQTQQKAAMDAFTKEDDGPLGESEHSLASTMSEIDVPERSYFYKSCELSFSIFMIFVRMIPVIMFILAIAFIIGYYEGWHPVTSIYYCVVTATTVGYGDIAPETQEMRLLAVFFLPCAVAVFGQLLGNIAQEYMDAQSKENEQRFLQQELTLSDLKAMDADGDGDVDMAEFLSFMLVAMQKVDKESVDEIKALFNKLDVDNSGTLSKDDLKIMTKRKQKATKQKLRESLALKGPITFS